MPDKALEAGVNDDKNKGLAEVKSQTFFEKYGSCRWVIAYLTCMARLSQTALRQFIGMSVVCMQDGNTSLVGNQSLNGTMGTKFAENSLTDFKIAEFDWSSEFEGLILTSYTIGFIFTPVVGGYLAGKFGSKMVIAMSVLIGSLATILTPVAARWNADAMVGLRIVVGFFMGTVDPAIQGLWAKWAPKYEKSQLTTTSFSGVAIAGILTFFISGFLCDIDLDNGWPFTFYVFGGYAFFVLIPWIFAVYDTPDSHPRISEKERSIIYSGNTSNQMKKMPNPPWLKIFTSPPFWSIIIAHISYSWVTSWVMAYLPTYMKEVLDYDIEENGMLASMPFVGRFISGLLCGFASDWLLQRHIFSTATIRKIFQFTGNFVCAACTITIGFLDKDQRTIAVVLLVVGLSFQNFTSVAFRINHLDIAPRYASVLMGITMTCAFAAALSAPLITAAIVKEHTRQEWQIVFFLVAGLNIVGGLVFVVFAKGEEQEWAKVTAQKDPSAELSAKTPNDSQFKESSKYGNGNINKGYHGDNESEISETESELGRKDSCDSFGKENGHVNNTRL
ncbi:sialin-like [Haliotis asinina]|uniref:sialin-like n=1 Tax=Haliotis asinina TaxID=109174 RepID=UPI0035321882